MSHMASMALVGMGPGYASLQELLRGVLCSNVIGYLICPLPWHPPWVSGTSFAYSGFLVGYPHGTTFYGFGSYLMFDYTRHFLHSCERFLGLQYHSRRGGLLCIQINDRYTRPQPPAWLTQCDRQLCETSSTTHFSLPWLSLVRHLLSTSHSLPGLLGLVTTIVSPLRR